MVLADQKIWVLIVEDASISRKLLANQLHKKGFEVICAEDGEQATEILTYCTPDCILLDMIMPKMHGHAFLSWLREKNQSLPVIILSAIDDQPNLIATMEELGIEGWISKPFDPEDISRRIKEALEPESGTEEPEKEAANHEDEKPKED